VLFRSTASGSSPEGGDPNARSLILRARTGRFEALLTGDAEAELAPIDPGPVDLPKVAHPQSEKPPVRKRVYSPVVPVELKKKSQGCKRFGNKHEDILDNSGLPYSKIYSYFSYALICWLKENKMDVDLDNYPEDAYTLNEALWLCLPAYERDIVQQELNNTQLLSALKIKPDQYLNFLLGQFSKLDRQAAIRDYLFERQKLVIRLALDLKVSRSYNKIKFEKTYLQKDWIKKIQTEEWVKIPVPLDRKLSEKDKQAIITSSRIKLALLQRETDPVSYMDPRSIRYFAL